MYRLTGQYLGSSWLASDISCTSVLSRGYGRPRRPHGTESWPTAVGAHRQQGHFACSSRSTPTIRYVRRTGLADPVTGDKVEPYGRTCPEGDRYVSRDDAVTESPFRPSLS